MSKTSQKNKEDKLKGKQKKIAEANAKKEDLPAKSHKSGILNYGCCCTCSHFPHKVNHMAQPCGISKKYVARKAKYDCYKCKFN